MQMEITKPCVALVLILFFFFFLVFFLLVVLIERERGRDIKCWENFRSGSRQEREQESKLKNLSPHHPVFI